jgi:hypothetical protein
MGVQPQQSALCFVNENSPLSEPDELATQQNLLGLQFDSPLLATNLAAGSSSVFGTRPCDSITESARTTENWHRSSEERHAEEGHSFIIDQSIDDGRLWI